MREFFLEILLFYLVLGYYFEFYTPPPDFLVHKKKKIKNFKKKIPSFFTLFLYILPHLLDDVVSRTPRNDSSSKQQPRRP